MAWGTGGASWWHTSDVQMVCKNMVKAETAGEWKWLVSLRFFYGFSWGCPPFGKKIIRLLRRHENSFLQVRSKISMLWPRRVCFACPQDLMASQGICIIVFIICVYIQYRSSIMPRVCWYWGSWQLSSAACWVWVSGCFGVKFVRASLGCASFGTRALDHPEKQQQDSSFHVSSKDLVVLVVFICLHWVLGCLGSWSPFFCFFGDDVIICTSNMAAEFHLRIPFNLCCS